MKRTPSAKNPASSLPSRAKLIATLTQVDLNQIGLTEAAAQLNIEPGDLITLVENDATLQEEVAQAVSAIRLDPEHAVRRSVEGLNAVADALAKRVTADHENMSTSELAAAGNLLDKVSAVSAQRVADTKKAAKEDDDPLINIPVGVVDTRPRPNGTTWGALFYLPSTHAAAREVHAAKFNRDMTDEEREAATHAWLDKWFPLNEAGVCIDLAHRIGAGGWWMDPTGKKHSGVPA